MTTLDAPAAGTATGRSGRAGRSDRAGRATGRSGRAGTAPRRGVARAISLLGPAFVAAIAYVDPGNVSTNLAAGSRFGYLLVWVVVLASVMAMLVQYLAAKLGVATGRDLAELCRERVSPWTARLLWVEGEIVMATTDVAEVIGAAIGLQLLFGVPVVLGGAIAGAVALAILVVERRGYRPFELVVTALLLLIAAGFLYEMVRAGPSVTAALSGLRPQLGGGGATELAVGIVGATIMPHALYLHSSLSTKRPSSSAAARAAMIAGLGPDILLALGLATVVNVAMLVAAAGLFHGHGHTTVTLAGAHLDIGRLLGGTAAMVFAASLFVSGAASSTVGTYAGDVVMRGFTRLRIPTWARRLATIGPAIVVLAACANPTQALVLTQVVLAIGLPFALVPLVVLTSKRAVMGAHVNRRTTTWLAGAVAAVVVGLDACMVLPH